MLLAGIGDPSRRRYLVKKRRRIIKVRFKERYLVDENGNRVGVLLDITDYQKLLEELEELDSIRAYDIAKASGDEAIPFERAVSEIERGR
jgi:hypothetical protein